MKTIATQIEDLETKVTKCESRLDDIERLCRLTSMTDEEWQQRHDEKKTIEQQICDFRKQLKELRWENWKTMFVSVILLGFGYLFFRFLFGSSNDVTAGQ